MGIPLPKESRRNIRRPLMGDLTGQLFVAESGRPVPCLAVDVSIGGLRILAREELPLDTAMLLSIADCTIPLFVVWCHPDIRSSGFYACGLASSNETDIEKFFVSIGWLEDNRKTEEWICSLHLSNTAEEPEE